MQVRVRPALPELKKAAFSATLHLMDIEDARPENTAPEQVGRWQTRPFVIERPLTEKLGSLTQDLLEKGGFRVLRGSSPEPGTPRLVGKLEEFETALRDSTSGFDYKPLVCMIRLRLNLEIDRKLLAQKTLRVEHMRRGANILGESSIGKVVGESMEQLMDQAADFIESEEFRDALAKAKS